MSFLSNLDKLYWPKEKISKGDLIHYYETVASYMLPYLKNRPIVLLRYPNGIDKMGFYQKEIGYDPPPFIKTANVQHDEKMIRFLLIDNKTSLLYAVNLGSIDLHPFLAPLDHLDKPDFCVIDIDPQGIAFEYVIEATLYLHEFLEKIKVKNFIKTSGGRGLHIYIPFHGKYDFEQSKQFAELIVTYVNKQLPKTTSLIRDPKKRQKKIYLDFLQNRKRQTVVAPYSVRPRPHALVSTPLEWSEVNEKLDPQAFNIHTVPARLKKIGDIFKPILGAGINLPQTLKRIPDLSE